LYFLFTGDHVAADVIASTLRAEIGYIYGVGVLASRSGSGVLLSGEIPDSAFKAIALATEHIIVEAYDGDAELIWSRGSK
jgi:hypothetical protein